MQNNLKLILSGGAEKPSWKKRKLNKTLRQEVVMVGVISQAKNNTC